MQEWGIHWLEAEGNLRPWQDPITAGIEEAHSTISRRISLSPLDILVERRSGNVIPEIGMLGRAWRKSLFSLTIDPDNPNFSNCLVDGTLSRQVAHEVHHCLRMGGPGYGRTLGEALVSEGLAGQFVRELFGNAPEPWECAVKKTYCASTFPMMKRWLLPGTIMRHGFLEQVESVPGGSATRWVTRSSANGSRARDRLTGQPGSMSQLASCFLQDENRWPKEGHSLSNRKPRMERSEYI